MRPIPPDELHYIWPWVREGLQNMIEKCREKILPEDFYASIKSGNAFLFEIGDKQAFMILQKHMDPDGPVLFVWALCGEGMLKQAQALYDDVERIAKAEKCRRIRMQSPRKAWERIGFFKAKTVVYEREVA